MDFVQYAGDAISSQISNIAFGSATGASLYAANKMRKSYSTPTTSNKSLAKQNAYKINKLYKQVKINTAELHLFQSGGSLAIPTLTATAIELTAIGTGDDLSQRSGRQIRVRGINCRTHTENINIDVYLILSPTGQGAPAITDFVASVGGHLNSTVKDDYKELAYFRNANASNSFYNMLNKKFNIITKYNGATSGTGIKNRIYLVFVNRGGVSYNVDYSVKMYFNAD